MKILHISDTHNQHAKLTQLPIADIIVHSGDFTHFGTEEEVLGFLNWFITLPHPNKIFVTGNHDLCLWEAENIEDLPKNVYFLQDQCCIINGIKFFGLAYNHPENLIPQNIDVLITHEPPMMILDNNQGMHYGNLPLYKKVIEIKPKLHLFGHAHDSYGFVQIDNTKFYNAALLNNQHKLCQKPHIIDISVS